MIRQQGRTLRLTALLVSLTGLGPLWHGIAGGRRRSDLDTVARKDLLGLVLESEGVRLKQVIHIEL